MLSRLVLALLLLALYPLGAHAAATITVQPSGATSYTVQGTGMDGVGGIDLTLSYDASILASPTVTAGGLVSGTQGAILVPNASLPGTIRIAVISTKPFSGNGSIATVSFASRKAPGGMRPPSLGSVIDTRGGVLPGHAYLVGEAETSAPSATSPLNSTSTTASTSTSTSTPDSTSTSIPATETASTSTPDSAPTAEPSPIPASTSISTSASPPALPVTIAAPLPTAQRSSTTTSAPKAHSTTTSSVPGTVTIPPDSPERNNRQDTGRAQSPETAVEPSPLPAQEAATIEPRRPAETQAIAKAPSAPKMQVNRSVLERFRVFRGERTPDAFKKLFTAEAPSPLLQKPSIAISDGTSTVTLSFTPEQGTETSPNFALSGARLLSINRVKGVWVIEALPAKESIQASLTVLSGGTMVEYPITVIPPAAGITASETDFALFLKESGFKPPKRDLNRDGRHDYRDDYIYTGHYLIQAARLKAQAQKQSPPGQQQISPDRKQAQAEQKSDSPGKKGK